MIDTNEFRYRRLMRVRNVEAVCIYPYPHDTMCDIKSHFRKFAVLPEQTHSLNVGIAESLTDYLPDTDAVITFKHNLPIGVVTADCVPIVVYTPDVEGVAVIHAGWRGSLGGIIDHTIDRLIEHGASPSNMIVAFGPSISKNVYEVDENLADKFIKAGFADYVSHPNGYLNRPHIDLQGVNIERLLRKGVRRENIISSPDCTYATVDAACQPVYQSYRRSKGAPGRNLTLIYLADSSPDFLSNTILETPR